MRYTLWFLAAVCIGVLLHAFITAMNGGVSAAVPDDYRFAVTNNYSEGSRVRTSYYVYDDKIIVVDESFTDDEVILHPLVKLIAQRQKAATQKTPDDQEEKSAE